MTMITQQTESGAAKIIAGLDDITLVDTLVRISTQTEDGPIPEVGREPRACLFDALDQGVFRPVTLVLNDHWGDLHLKTGRLSSATIEPCHWRKGRRWKLSVTVIEPGNKHPSNFSWDFPIDPVLLMWGMHDALFNNPPPPPLTFAAAWREVARRCHATGQVWLDTTAAAIKVHEARNMEVKHDQR
jgi:hypothetical protein